MPKLNGPGGRWFQGLSIRTRRTFFLDCLRGIFAGIIDTGPKTFFLLIAVKQYAAGDLAKSLIAVPTAVGMLLAVLLIPFYGRLRARKSAIAGWGRLLAAFCFFLAAINQGLQGYIVWIFAALVFHPITIPLLTSVYHENYPAHVRGKLFAVATTLNLTVSAFFHWQIGRLLDAHMEYYRLVLVGFGILSLFTAWALWRMPSIRPKSPARGNHRGMAAFFSFFQAFRWIKRDKAFAYLLLVWFLFGFASLMTLPLKVLYLSEARFGLVFATATIALLIGVIPDLLRLVSTPIWAYFFDRYNFIGIRIVMNFFLLASLALFFHSRTLPFLAAAQVLEGIFFAGGNLAWSLWVTRYAPPGRTSEYMAVHQFFTGVRGILGVFIGINIAGRVGVQPVAWLAIGLVALSIILMLPMRHFGSAGARAPR